jgi:hypothetical protein
MSEHDGFAKRGRALEEEYFRKKDRELIEKIRQAAAADEVRKDTGRMIGIDDPALLRELHDLGFTPETVGLLPLMPIIQMAWAEGGITKAERELILRLARSRGVEAGSAADRQLTEWMTNRPEEAVHARARRLIHAMLDAGSTQTGDLKADDLVKYCEDIAAASGGILGIGRISAEERALLSSIAAGLLTPFADQSGPLVGGGPV